MVYKPLRYPKHKRVGIQYNGQSSLCISNIYHVNVQEITDPKQFLNYPYRKWVSDC